MHADIGQYISISGFLFSLWACSKKAARTARRALGARMRKKWILLCTALVLVACGGGRLPESKGTDMQATQHDFALSVERQKLFDRTCRLCHGVPGSGAPAPRDALAWEARVSQGLDIMLDHTINGHGAMPPMGMCMDCTQEDFLAFIRLMTGLECDE